jgi:hypothetical protein
MRLSHRRTSRCTQQPPRLAVDRSCAVSLRLAPCAYPPGWRARWWRGTRLRQAGGSSGQRKPEAYTPTAGERLPSAARTACTREAGAPASCPLRLCALAPGLRDRGALTRSKPARCRRSGLAGCEESKPRGGAGRAWWRPCSRGVASRGRPVVLSWCSRGPLV